MSFQSIFARILLCYMLAEDAHAFDAQCDICYGPNLPPSPLFMISPSQPPLPRFPTLSTGGSTSPPPLGPPLGPTLGPPLGPPTSSVFIPPTIYSPPAPVLNIRTTNPELGLWVPIVMSTLGGVLLFVSYGIYDMSDDPLRV